VVDFNDEYIMMIMIMSTSDMCELFLKIINYERWQWWMVEVMVINIMIDDDE
jgi:hypothetical protein